MQPILFELPGLGPVSGYQTLLAIGFVFGILLAYVLAGRRGVDRNHILDMALIAVIGGIVGARAFYYYEFYEKHFAHRRWYHLFYVHEGGYVFYGGFLTVVAAIGAYLLYQRRRARRLGLPPVRILRTLDVCAAPLALGLSFGRIGCLLNGCCWGLLDQGNALLALRFPAGSIPWKSHVDHGWIYPDALESMPIHATQVYSWAGALTIAALLLLALRWARRDGQTSGAFFLLYGAFRFVVEGFREHDPTSELAHFPIASDLVAPLGAHVSWISDTGLMTYSQMVSLVLLGLGVVWFGLASLLGPSPQPATAEAISQNPHETS